MAGRIEAFIFDMDGTLVDSEAYTGRAIEDLARQRGLDPRPVDPRRIEGVTWQEAARAVVEVYPALAGARLPEELRERFNDLMQDDPPRLIGGAEQALAAAGRAGLTALVSSSNRDSVELLLGRRGLLERFGAVVCAEDCTRSKPDPQCYALAARRLGCRADRCLVFEDSVAGLRAATAAGMRTVAIERGRTGAVLQEVRSLAGAWVNDFTGLDPAIFSGVPEAALPGRVSA